MNTHGILRLRFEQLSLVPFIIKPPLLPPQMIRHALNLPITIQMHTRLGQQTPILLQHVLIKAPDRHADPLFALVAPEEEAAAAAAEAARAVLRGAVGREGGVGGEVHGGAGDVVDAEDEAAGLGAALGALAGYALADVLATVRGWEIGREGRRTALEKSCFGGNVMV